MVPLPTSLMTGALQISATTATPTAAIAAASWWGTSAIAKLTAAGVGAITISGVTLAVIQHHEDRPQATATPPAATVSATPPTGRTAPSRRPASPSVTATSIPAARYGSVVDTAEPTPPKNRKPGPLPQRPEDTVSITASNDEDPRADVVSLIRRGQSVTYRGRGYLRIEWAIAYTQRTGTLTMPSWTGLDGKSSTSRPAAADASTTRSPQPSTAPPAWAPPQPAPACCPTAPNKCGNSSTTTSTAR
jgi:hypothetical protein